LSIDGSVIPRIFFTTRLKGIHTTGDTIKKIDSTSSFE
jgi:hypothetical protein